MLPKETEEMKWLWNNHIFMTNQCYNEVIKSTIFETEIQKEQYLNFFSSIKFCLNEVIDIISDFEVKNTFDVH